MPIEPTHRSRTNTNFSLEVTLNSTCIQAFTAVQALGSISRHHALESMTTKDATEAGDLLDEDWMVLTEDSIERIRPCRAFALYHVKRSEVRQPAPRIPKAPIGISAQY